MEDAKMFIDRRAHPRYQVQFPVKYCFVRDKNEINAIQEFSKKDVVAVTRDISLGGMQIALEQPLQAGDILAFEIPLPGGSPPLSACAEVVWTNGNIGGLHFLILGEEDLTVLKAYLKKLGFRS